MAESEDDPKPAATNPPPKRRSWERPKPKIAPATERNKHGEAKTSVQRSGRQLNKIRVQKVQDLKEMLVPDGEIAKMVSTEFRCSKQTVYEDLRRIKAQWEEEAASRTPESSRIQAARTAQRMFGRLSAKGDHKTARRYFQDWCKITGAYQPTKVTIVDERDMSLEQLEAAAKEEVLGILAALTPEQKRELLGVG